MTSRVEELKRMCDNINENGGLNTGGWDTALLAQIAQNLAVIADVMMADRKTEPTISKMEQVEDEPQTELVNDSPILVKDLVEDYEPYEYEIKAWHKEHQEPYCEVADTPQTDCGWK